MDTEDPDAGERLLFKLLEDHGFEKRSAWLRLGNDVDSHRDAATETREKPKSKQAEAKVKQRREDRKNGWAECYAKAPDHDDARRLIAEIGKAIRAPRMRKAIRIVLRNPRTALVGEKVLRRQGLRWRIAHLVLGGPQRCRGTKTILCTRRDLSM